MLDAGDHRARCAGFSEAGLPVGIEIVTRPYDEVGMFRLGYAFEHATQGRRAPASTPET
jgi:Asp-tRNA(Asn)/Glu-tRNA(Gln) amidotransferase A subunit family amidase